MMMMVRLVEVDDDDDYVYLIYFCLLTISCDRHVTIR